MLVTETFVIFLVNHLDVIVFPKSMDCQMLVIRNSCCYFFSSALLFISSALLFFLFCLSRQLIFFFFQHRLCVVFCPLPFIFVSWRSSVGCCCTLYGFMARSRKYLLLVWIWKLSMWWLVGVRSEWNYIILPFIPCSPFYCHNACLFRSPFAFVCYRYCHNTCLSRSPFAFVCYRHWSSDWPEESWWCVSHVIIVL